MAHYTKKVSVGAFAKKGVDVKNGDTVTIANEGKKVQGQFGEQDVFLIKLSNGEEKNVNVNQTSINGLIDAYGEDSTHWIGKNVKVWLIKSNVAGKFVDVLYIAHPDADLTQDGFVLPVAPTGKPVKKKPVPVVDEYPEGDIESDDEEVL